MALVLFLTDDHLEGLTDLIAFVKTQAASLKAGVVEDIDEEMVDKVIVLSHQGNELLELIKSSIAIQHGNLD